MTSQRILLVEDDVKLGQQVKRSLEGHDYLVDLVHDGQRAIEIDKSPFSLIILDLMLPGADGSEVLRTVRGDSHVPVLILSARNESVDIVRTLMMGADDYMTKPFWPEELIARVHARLRRPSLVPDDLLRVGELELDFEEQVARVAGVDAALTTAQFRLIAELVRAQGRAVSRQRLVDRALDSGTGGGERTLDVHVSRLRKKLGACGPWIRTVWRTGYRFSPGDE